MVNLAKCDSTDTAEDCGGGGGTVLRLEVLVPKNMHEEGWRYKTQKLSIVCFSRLGLPACEGPRSGAEEKHLTTQNRGKRRSFVAVRCMNLRSQFTCRAASLKKQITISEQGLQHNHHRPNMNLYSTRRNSLCFQSDLDLAPFLRGGIKTAPACKYWMKEKHRLRFVLPGLGALGVFLFLCRRSSSPSTRTPSSKRPGRKEGEVDRREGSGRGWMQWKRMDLKQFWFEAETVLVVLSVVA